MATKTPQKPKSTKKSPAKVDEKAGARQLKTPKYKHFRLQKRIKHPEVKKLPGSFRLFGQAIKTVTKKWKFFLGIVVIYGLLNVIFVTGLSAGGSITDLKQAIDQVFGSKGPNVNTGAALFAYMLGNTGSATGTAAGGYQITLLIIASLAIIWGLRQVYTNQNSRIRDAYYLGMYPLVPFLLVIFAIGVQLVPIALGAVLYNTAISSGAAVFFIEKLLWGTVFFGLTVVSLYLVCGSIFAPYIATLHNMTPLKALRSSIQLVQFRRWTIMRRILFLPLALVVFAAIVMLPAILFVTPAAPWVFFVLTLFALLIAHSYVYALYRELL